MDGGAPPAERRTDAGGLLGEPLEGQVPIRRARRDLLHRERHLSHAVGVRVEASARAGTGLEAQPARQPAVRPGPRFRLLDSDHRGGSPQHPKSVPDLLGPGRGGTFAPGEAAGLVQQALQFLRESDLACGRRGRCLPPGRRRVGRGRLQAVAARATEIRDGFAPRIGTSITGERGGISRYRRPRSSGNYPNLYTKANSFDSSCLVSSKQNPRPSCMHRNHNEYLPEDKDLRHHF